MPGHAQGIEVREHLLVADAAVFDRPPRDLRGHRHRLGKTEQFGAGDVVGLSFVARGGQCAHGAGHAVVAGHEGNGSIVRVVRQHARGQGGRNHRHGDGLGVLAVAQEGPGGARCLDGLLGGAVIQLHDGGIVGLVGTEYGRIDDVPDPGLYGGPGRILVLLHARADARGADQQHPVATGKCGGQGFREVEIRLAH